MAINEFRDWLKNKENSLFWREPFASEKMDAIIVDKDIQKSIAKDRDNQKFYSYIEGVIVNDYATLIDLKLRQKFHSLSIQNFKDPSGFEKRKVSSLAQQDYFDTRNMLEFFFKQDITQHDNPDAQLNAFRRWVDVSNSLLKRHCYEGFLLVIVNLQLLANSSLIQGLPACSRETYAHMCRLSSSTKNHAALRKYIQDNQSDIDLPPLLFWYHALISLNVSMEKLMHSKDILNRRMEIIANEKVIHDEQFTNEITDVNKQIKEIDDSFALQLVKRDEILAEISAAQQVMPGELPAQQTQTYNQLVVRYNRHVISIARDQEASETKAAQPDSYVSKLYSDKLLPSFWNRGRKSTNSYWKSIFTDNITSCDRRF